MILGHINKIGLISWFSFKRFCRLIHLWLSQLPNLSIDMMILKNQTVLRRSPVWSFYSQEDLQYRQVDTRDIQVVFSYTVVNIDVF